MNTIKPPRVTELNFRVGLEVIPGEDWKWEDQHKGAVGKITGETWKDPTDKQLYVNVDWNGNKQHYYRIGPDYFDLYVKEEELVTMVRNLTTRS